MKLTDLISKRCKDESWLHFLGTLTIAFIIAHLLLALVEWLITGSYCW